MATGGIFTIITNDGKQDRMLMATALLHERLKAINQFKMATNGGPANATQNLPSLTDIEKTHVLFTNAHFKPFAAIGFEYNKVRATSGNPALGQTIQFSIPQFGDFFNDTTCHVILNQPTLTPDGGTADSDSPLMRWANFPGERLLESVQQEVNGNPLDEYTHHATNMHREYRVSASKRLAWDRCVGQEEAERGFVSQPNWAASGVAPASVTSRMRQDVHVGAQTPTGQKTGTLELFIPLLFWYNKDVRLAVPSVSIPYGQRFINIQLASLENLVGVVPRGAGTWAAPNGSLVEGSTTLQTIELYINNIFVNPEVHQIYIKRVGFSLIRVHRQQLYNANTSSQEVLLSQMKWPIEFLFVGMKVKDYHAGSTSTLKRQHLDKWHTFHQRSTQTYTSVGQEVEQTSLLTEADGVATLGVAGVVDATAANPTLSGTATAAQALAIGDIIRVGGLPYSMVAAVAAGAALTGEEVLGPNIDQAASTGISDAARFVTVQGLQVETERCTRTLDTVSVKAHGINIYQQFPVGFYNAYTAYHYGGPNISAPEDCGTVFIPFCLYPGTYQPSGHINVSRAREFYLSYESSVIDGSTDGTLVVIASAINFLLISDGSAVLRYST